MSLGQRILTAGIHKKRIRNLCCKRNLLHTKIPALPNGHRLGTLTESEKSFGVELENLKRLETVHDFADFFQYSLLCQRLTKYRLATGIYPTGRRGIKESITENPRFSRFLNGQPLRIFRISGE